jgi:hypothetical protein
MEKRNNVLFGIILIGIIAFILFVGIRCPHEEKESNTAIINAQKEILRIDTIVKRYDSIIYRTKIKTNEKIRIIYLWPDSVLVDSIRARLQDFDSIGTPKNLSSYGAE